MKTKEELNALKNEFEEMNAKLAELTDEEMELVLGGWEHPPKKKRPIHRDNQNT